MEHLYKLSHITGEMINLQLLMLGPHLMVLMSMSFRTHIAWVFTTRVHPSMIFHMNMPEEMSSTARMCHFRNTKTMTMCFSMAHPLQNALCTFGVDPSDVHQLMECYTLFEYVLIYAAS